MMNKFKQLPADREDGFTLIELLVVILIIGILAAIAIPAFLNQRRSAVDAAVKSDVTNVGDALMTEALAGRSIDRTMTLTEDGVVSEDDGSAFMRVASTTPDFLADLKVSQGTSLIIQPSAIDGTVCIFAVNPGGDIAAKAPGFVFDSNAGGLLREDVSPSACADETGELNVPLPAIERALGGETGSPVEDQPAEDEPGTDNGTPQSLRTTGKLVDSKKKCQIPGTDYTFTGTATADSVDWSIEGLDDFPFDNFRLYFTTSDGTALQSPVYRGNTRSGTMSNTLGTTDFFLHVANSEGEKRDTYEYIKFGSYIDVPDCSDGEAGGSAENGTGGDTDNGTGGTDGGNTGENDLGVETDEDLENAIYANVSTRYLYDTFSNCHITGTKNIIEGHYGNGVFRWSMKGYSTYESGTFSVEVDGKDDNFMVVTGDMKAGQTSGAIKIDMKDVEKVKIGVVSVKTAEYSHKTQFEPKLSGDQFCE